MFSFISQPPVQTRRPAQGLEATVVRVGLDQAPVAVLRCDGGLALQGTDRPGGGAVGDGGASGASGHEKGGREGVLRCELDLEFCASKVGF